MSSPRPREPAPDDPERRRAGRPPRVFDVDVTIVGGGLSGASAAVVLGRAGYRVALVDLHAVYPQDFRVEKLAGDQLELLQRVGLFDVVAAASSPFGEVLNARSGIVIDRTRARHYGILYDTLVGVVRAQLPNNVDLLIGRVADVQACADRQRVTLSNGDVVEARLLVLATGLGDALRQKLGIKRRMLFDRHSLTFGFTVAPRGRETFPFSALTYYGERVAHRIDYLNIFPASGGMRANLFTFLDPREPWVVGFRRDPKAALEEIMPGLDRLLGSFDVVDKVQVGPMDLYAVEGHRRDGVVLIGDAFQTSCPAAGTGVSRLLTDVDRLCNVHVPRWLATPGMGADKIATFYDDEVKRAADAKALRLADYRRSLAVNASAGWEFHRRRMYWRRRVVGWLAKSVRTRVPRTTAESA